MKRAIKETSAGTYFVADFFDEADVQELTREQIMTRVANGEEFYGVSSKGRISVFRTTQDLIIYDTALRKLANQPVLKYDVDYDEISWVGVDFPFEGGFDIRLPEFVNSIGVLEVTSTSAFIKSLYMPDTILELNDEALSAMIYLERVRLSERLVDLPSSVLSWSYALTQIRVPASVSYIGTNAFRLSGIQEVYFDDDGSLESISDLAFADTDLRCLHIPDSVTSLGECCFMNCRNLVAASLPVHLKEYIESNKVFSSCSNIQLRWR